MDGLERKQEQKEGDGGVSPDPGGIKEDVYGGLAASSIVTANGQRLVKKRSHRERVTGSGSEHR